MQKFYNRRPAFVIIILMMFGFIGQPTASEVVEIGINVSVILSSPLQSDDDKIPNEIRELALPFQDEDLCGKSTFFRPNVSIMRADSTKSKLESLLPITDKSVFDSFAEFIGKKPDYKVVLKRTQDILDKLHVPKNMLEKGDKGNVTLDEMMKSASFDAAKMKFMLLGQSSDADIDKGLDGLLPKNEKSTKFILARNIEEFHKSILEGLCGTSKIKSENIAVIYHPMIQPPCLLPSCQPPLLPPPPCQLPSCQPPSKDVLCQDQARMAEAGRIYESAKKTSDKVQKDKQLREAFGIYDGIVKECQAEGVKCPVKNLMNRGVMYSQLGNTKSALADLLQAEECDGKDAEVLYNLACIYSKDSSISSSSNSLLLALALKKLEQAKDNGFKNCEVLKQESDLESLRKKYPDDFKKIQDEIQEKCNNQP